MRQPFLCLGVVLAAAALLSCAQQPVPIAAENPSLDADTAAIEVLIENNASLLSSEDLAGWGDQFTEDAVFMRPDAEVVVGRELSREAIRPWFELFDMEAAATVDEIKVFGDRAFVRWSFAFQ